MRFVRLTTLLTLHAQSPERCRAHHAMSTTGRVRFGVIADVQHADLPVGQNYAKTVTRHYRGALAQLARAAEWWSAQATGASEPLACIVNLGDVIDGQCAKHGQSETALADALAHFGRVRVGGDGGELVPTVHCVGNHELMNFPDRAELRARLNGAGRSPDYCAIPVGVGVRLLVLDPYAIAMMTPAEGPTRAAARAMLKAHNPNDIEAQGDFTVGLARDKRHFVPYNGALGDEQLAWLRAEVASAAAARERVVVLTHAPLHPDACERSTMPWDYELALAALRGEDARSTVVAVLAGHDHNGGFARDDDGVLHVTFQSPLNKGDDGDAYGLVELAGDELLLHGPQLADLLPAALLPPDHVDGTPVRLQLRAAAPAASPPRA